MSVIAVANTKGGSGKTTTVFNLSAEFARRGNRVLVIDMDPQSSLTGAYKITFPENQVYLDEILNTEKIDPNSAIYKVSESLHLIPGREDLNSCEYYLTKDAFRLRNIVQRIGIHSYDYFIIDTPGTSDVFMGAALCAADEIIIPVRPSDFDITALVTFKTKIDDIRRDVNPNLKIRGLLFNQVITRSKNSSQYRSMFRDHELGKCLLKTEIRMSTAIQNSPSFGLDIGTKNRDSESAGDYLKLANEVLQWQQQ